VKKTIARLAWISCELCVIAATGCAGSPVTQSSFSGNGGIARPQSIRIVPDRFNPTVCGVSKSFIVNSAGGRLVVPACDNFYDWVGYPPNDAPARTMITLTHYDTDPGGGSGQPPSGTVIAWIKFRLTAASNVTFNSSPEKAAMIRASQSELSKSNSYSLYVFVNGQQAQSPRQLGSPTCGAHCVLTFKSFMNGQTFPQGFDIFYELVQN
jgi:hypothetical protein